MLVQISVVTMVMAEVEVVILGTLHGVEAALSMETTNLQIVHIQAQGQKTPRRGSRS